MKLIVGYKQLCIKNLLKDPVQITIMKRALVCPPRIEATT